jgi:formylglycine-generating enzyme required for sulfatase activity
VRVALNGQDIGVTPLTTKLDAGSYTLSLAAEGFRTWESAIQVQANVAQKIGPVQMGLPDGKLTLRSNPSQADVAIAGRYRGRTPLEVDLAPGVEHEIVIQRAGYEPAQRRVPIKSAERLALEVTLKPMLGEVTVRGQPADAVLYVGGQSRGPANQTLKIPAVETALEVRRVGFETFTTTVTPQPGFARLVEYTLLTPEAKRTAKVPPSVKLDSGIELLRMPTGSYQMGSSRREPGRRPNESQRKVTLQRTFYIGVHEVTNAQFRKFRADHASGIIGERSLDLDNQPVVNLKWRDAAEFCNWLSMQQGLPPAYVMKGEQLTPAEPMTTGYRLPTEAEWEWAARYENGAATRRFAWGGALPVAPKSGNYADRSALEIAPAVIENYDDGFTVTAPVGSFAPNALGLYDLGGNVAEWTHDAYSSYVDLDKGSAIDPLGPPSGRAHVVRGSSWRTSSVTELRLASRESNEGRSDHLGFRVARYAE